MVKYTEHNRPNLHDPITKNCDYHHPPDPLLRAPINIGAFPETPGAYKPPDDIKYSGNPKHDRVNQETHHMVILLLTEVPNLINNNKKRIQESIPKKTSNKNPAQHNRTANEQAVDAPGPPSALIASAKRRQFQRRVFVVKSLARLGLMDIPKLRSPVVHKIMRI
jgi:hypothetical protein